MLHIKELDFLVVRSFINTLLTFIVLKLRGQSVFNVKNLWMIILRCIAVDTSIICQVLALPSVPLGIMFTIAQTKFLWTAIMAYFIVGEVVSS